MKLLKISTFFTELKAISDKNEFDCNFIAMDDEESQGASNEDDDSNEEDEEDEDEDEEDEEVDDDDDDGNVINILLKCVFIRLTKNRI